VDSPGTNAIGGVHDVTFRFLEDANAILFVHRIEPIDTDSFRKFVNSVISNRSKETLFMVLTHTCNLPDPYIGKLHSEAVRLYKNDIPEERILIVDSLLKLIHNDLENGKTVEEIRKSAEKEIILERFIKKAEEEGRELKEVVYEGSRFEKMLETLDKFSMQAPNLQLQEILESIKNGYDYQDSQYKEKLDRLNKKKKSPQQFAAEIDRISKALEKYKNLMYNTREDLNAKYKLSKDSKWLELVDEIKRKYRELIDKSNTIEIARKHFIDSQNEIETTINNFSRELTDEFREIFEEVGKTFKEEYKITVPKVDFILLEKKAKTTTENEMKIRKWNFWDIITGGGRRKVYKKRIYLKSIKNQCLFQFIKIANSFNKTSQNFLYLYLNLFTKEMTAVIEARQKALQKEKNKKQSNNEIIIEIDKLKEKKNEIQPELKRAEEILENIK